MTDSKWKFATFIIGLVGIVLPIAWNWWTGRTSITLRHQSTSVLAQQTEGLDSLDIRWGNESYPSVAVVNFTLQNTGRTSIHRREITQPPTITFVNGTVLKTEAVSAFPPNTWFETEINSAGRRVAVQFSLLNPSDRVEFSVIVAATELQQGTYRPEFTASTRISGVPRLQVESTDTESKSNVFSELPWSVWLVAVMTAFMTLVLLVGLESLGEEVKTKKLVENDLIRVPSDKTLEEYQQWVESVLTEKTDSELEELDALLNSINTDEALTEEELQDLMTTFYQAATDISSVKTGLIVSFVITLAGYWYVLSSIIGG